MRNEKSGMTNKYDGLSGRPRSCSLMGDDGGFLPCGKQRESCDIKMFFKTDICYGDPVCGRCSSSTM